MKLLLQSLIILVFVSCGRNPNVKSDYDNIIDNEIANRYEMLSQSIVADSLIKTKNVSFSIIHEEVSNLILLTKDVENADAVISKVNTYFSEVVKKYNVSNEGFVVIVKTMSLPTIETTIKTNELNLLDKILFSLRSAESESVSPGSVY